MKLLLFTRTNNLKQQENNNKKKAAVCHSKTGEKLRRHFTNGNKFIS
jgi:hypothetical protein